MTGLPAEPAARHRVVADRFTTLVRGTSRWEAPTPVHGWVARDVVRHLLDWFPGFLEGGSDVRLPPGPSVDRDPLEAWRTHADSVQRVLDDPEVTATTAASLTLASRADPVLALRSISVTV